MELTKTDEGCTLKKSEHCYAVWKKKRRCENCISQEVLRTHKPQTKIETRASDIYYVLASFIEVDGRPYSLELVKRTKSDDMFERENVLNQLLVRDRQVYMDSVTKVYNRRYYDERLKQKKVNFFEAVYLLQPEKSSVAERRIMKLVLQTPLSVPELVRCFENNVHDVSSADKVISAIYTEESDNQARLNNASILSDHRHDVLEATANLYLTRQVILEHA